MRTPTPAETRSLLAMVDIALHEPDAASFLERQVPLAGSARLRGAAAQAADAMAAGEPPSRALAMLPRSTRAALAAGESVGRPEEGVRRALDALDLGARSRALVSGPLLQPLFALALGLLAAALAACLGAPAIHDLRTELSLASGEAPPSALLGLLAAHPRAVLTLGASAALLVLLSIPLATLMASTRRGSSTLLALPLTGPLLRARATAEMSGALAPMLAARAPLDVAHALAAESVTCASLRARLIDASPRVAAGDPLDEIIDACGMPILSASLRLHAGDGDGGVDACTEARARAESICERAASRLGRACALAAVLATTGVALVVVDALVLPLVAGGGP
jgi:type II secretory pathway component PulF